MSKDTFANPVLRASSQPAVNDGAMGSWQRWPRSPPEAVRIAGLAALNVPDKLPGKQGEAVSS